MLKSEPVGTLFWRTETKGLCEESQNKQKESNRELTRLPTAIWVPSGLYVMLIFSPLKSTCCEHFPAVIIIQTVRKVRRAIRSFIPFGIASGFVHLKQSFGVLWQADSQVTQKPNRPTKFKPVIMLNTEPWILTKCHLHSPIITGFSSCVLHCLGKIHKEQGVKMIVLRHCSYWARNTAAKETT